jgi:RNA polymerase sigma-70 factor (ECF subfamily)
MAETPPIEDLLRRVRAGDEDAVRELVRRYESEIRRIARLRLHPRLRRVLDSTDICQSVLHSFFVRAALGEYELNTAEDLLRLLAGMVRHKVASQARREHAQRRDQRRTEADDTAVREALTPEASPSRIVAGRELLQQFRERLSEQERRLADLRAQGQEWSAIAAQLGESAEALRKRLERGIRRVARALGLEDFSHA